MSLPIFFAVQLQQTRRLSYVTACLYENYSDIYVLFAVKVDGIVNEDGKELDIIGIGVYGCRVLRQGEYA